ncbi:Imm1 family immunity protein [Saccharothrix mutabilis subsp. capreolus]|uniref:Imm1 family immunity protein n=1 Tax=Saccharothrix mutabilis TaxID=33921 RepID=UPI0035E5B02B
MTELRSEEDVDRFLHELAHAGPDHTAATVYAIDPDSVSDFPDHELTVGLNAANNVGAIRYSGEEGTWYSQGPTSNPQGVRFAYFGNAHDFPPNAEVPVTEVRAAVIDLLANGGSRPAVVTWQEAIEA